MQGLQILPALLPLNLDGAGSPCPSGSSVIHWTSLPQPYSPCTPSGPEGQPWPLFTPLQTLTLQAEALLQAARAEQAEAGLRAAEVERDAARRQVQVLEAKAHSGRPGPEEVERERDRALLDNADLQQQLDRLQQALLEKTKQVVELGRRAECAVRSRERLVDQFFEQTAEREGCMQDLQVSHARERMAREREAERLLDEVQRHVDELEAELFEEKAVTASALARAGQLQEQLQEQLLQLHNSAAQGLPPPRKRAKGGRQGKGAGRPPTAAAVARPVRTKRPYSRYGQEELLQHEPQEQESAASPCFYDYDASASSSCVKRRKDDVRTPPAYPPACRQQQEQEQQQQSPASSVSPLLHQGAAEPAVVVVPASAAASKGGSRRPACLDMSVIGEPRLGSPIKRVW